MINKKIKKGITVISVALMVAVMSIIATTIIVSSVSIVTKTKLNKFVREVDLIEKSFETYKIRNNGNIIGAVTGEPINPPKNTGITNKLYKINLYNIGVEEASYGSEKTLEDRYLIDVSTGKVYYENGIKIKKDIYYSITEEMRTDIKK